jgi:hypothetical protein
MELSAMSEKNVYRREAAKQAERFNIDPELYVRLIERESGFDPNAKGAAGEIGLSQIMLETGIKPGMGVTPIQDRSDPVDNLRFGAEYLGALIEEFGGDYTKALQAYNGGLGNVQKGTVSSAAENYASSLLGGKEVKGAPMRPEPRPSGIVPQAEDKANANAIEKALRDLFAEASGPKAPAGRPPSGRYRSSGRMSPLSGTGIPGLGNIKRYSTPGGIESLYKR